MIAKQTWRSMTQKQRANKIARISWLFLAVLFAIGCLISVSSGAKAEGIGFGAVGIGYCALYGIAAHEHKYHGE